VVLLSAGIGITPLLAMLYDLSAARCARGVFWLHATRDGEHHPFAADVRGMVDALPHARRFVCFSAPGAGDRPGIDFDAAGRFSRSVFETLHLPQEAEVYLCGPSGFMANMKDILVSLDIAAQRIHTEIFNGGESLTPGVVNRPAIAPHRPANDVDAGVSVSFSRSGIAAHWNASAYQSILELAEACDVPVRWSCRTGVCHNCESGLVSGRVSYDPAPLDEPAEGNLLVCCSRPESDVVIDL
jgi:ferredoxin-NADP reductase